jgi:hypothetical protein
MVNHTLVVLNVSSRIALTNVSLVLHSEVLVT